MPRNFSELKSGVDNSYAVPHPEKWGDVSPRPPPIDARGWSGVNSKLKKPLCYAIYNSYVGNIYLKRGHGPP